MTHFESGCRTFMLSLNWQNTVKLKTYAREHLPVTFCDQCGNNINSRADNSQLCLRLLESPTNTSITINLQKSDANQLYYSYIYPPTC